MNSLQTKKLSVIIILVISLYCSINVRGQEKQNSFIFDVGLWSKNNAEQSRIHAKLGHEWKPTPYFGIELSGLLGTASGDDFSWKNQSNTPETPHNNYNSDLRFRTLSSKFKGYLNLKYNERDEIETYLFAGLGLGLASIKCKGQTTINEKKQNHKMRYPLHLYNNFELGLGTKCGQNWIMEVGLNLDNLKFEEALGKMNKKLIGVPIHDSSSFLNTTIQVSFKYLY